MGKLDGQVAIITGASSGFGYAAAKLFAQEGCQVLATARRVERLDQLVAETTDAPGRGQLIYVSSAAGVYGYPHESMYSSSKFALRGLAQSMDGELRQHGIKSCAFCPGAGITEFAVGHGRSDEQMDASGMLTPDQVADMFLFICTRPDNVRIIELRTRAMNEPLTPGDAGFQTN